MMRSPDARALEKLVKEVSTNRVNVLTFEQYVTNRRTICPPDETAALVAMGRDPGEARLYQFPNGWVLSVIEWETLSISGVHAEIALMDPSGKSGVVGDPLNAWSEVQEVMLIAIVHAFPPLKDGLPQEGMAERLDRLRDELTRMKKP